jgi:hypothetical protein
VWASAISFRDLHSVLPALCIHVDVIKLFIPILLESGISFIHGKLLPELHIHSSLRICRYIHHFILRGIVLENEVSPVERIINQASTTKSCAIVALYGRECYLKVRGILLTTVARLDSFSTG